LTDTDEPEHRARIPDMPTVLLEGYTIDEVLALPRETMDALVLRDEPLVLRIGTAGNAEDS